MRGMVDDDKDVPFHGTRGPAFEKMICNLLKRTGLPRRFYDRSHPRYDANRSLTSDWGIWSAVFTHPSINASSNYEWYEFLGDSTVGLAIVRYLTFRFPQIVGRPSGVRLGTRLKINTVSRDTLEKLGSLLGFDPFISATMEFRSARMKALREDVFEACVGLISDLVDRVLRSRSTGEPGRLLLGAGFQACFQLVSSCLDEMEICGGVVGRDGIQRGQLPYRLLVDAKTRLKELLDKREYADQLGQLRYQTERIQDRSYTKVSVSGSQAGRIVLGEAFGLKQSDSQQKAAELALTRLREAGYERPIPPGYAEFCYR